METAVCFRSSSRTTGPRPPLPMMPFRPSSSSRGVYLSIRLAVVGPAAPITWPGRSGVGPT